MSLIKDDPARPIRTMGDLGAALRSARLHRGLTQAALAARAGVSRSWLAGVERGRLNPTVEGLLRVLEALDASLRVSTADLPTAPTTMIDLDALLDGLSRG